MGTEIEEEGRKEKHEGRVIHTEGWNKGSSKGRRKKTGQRMKNKDKGTKKGRQKHARKYHIMTEPHTLMK
jgi:hypothetical protein